MRKLLLTLLLILHATLLIAKDYDCVIVGSSPVSLIEALYQEAAGKEVLILEGDSQCGGAWRAIDICGVAHVDMGCHHIGGNSALADFFSALGCKVISMSDPTQAYNPSNAPLGLYFPQGCYDLISTLEASVQRSSIDLKLNCRLENVFFNEEWALLDTSTGESHRTKKIYHTPASSFSIEGKQPFVRGSKYYHLYLLIADGGPIRCSYRTGFPGVSRIMNLTPFAGLTASGLQLFALQLHAEEDLKKSENFLKLLKSSGLVTLSARIIREDSYIYVQNFSSGLTGRLPKEQKIFFENLDTSHLCSTMQQNLHRYFIVSIVWLPIMPTYRVKWVSQIFYYST